MENKSLFTETTAADEFNKYSKVKTILIIKAIKRRRISHYQNFKNIASSTGMIAQNYGRQTLSVKDLLQLFCVTYHGIEIP